MLFDGLRIQSLNFAHLARGLQKIFVTPYSKIVQTPVWIEVGSFTVRTHQQEILFRCSPIHRLRED